ncbi:SapC family protein [Streptomyces wuyuanensis]|uniref:SapC family protein n=1 Tax=Streptomyces wuyuanensis TaxID=1196353 RepID=UPI003D7117F3
MRIVQLSREDHAPLRMTLPRNARFAATEHLVSLQAAEFAEAAVAYPIVFFEGPTGLTPCALQGLQQGRNQYVTADGSWRPHAYRPAMIRAYPFFLVEEQDGQFGVGIDAEYEGWSTVEGDRLFEDDGSPAPVLADRLELLQWCVTETPRTQEFTKELLRLRLLKQETLTVTGADGTSVALGEYWVVDEERLQSFSLGDPLVDLIGLIVKGYLGAIHAHLISLHHLPRLTGELIGG